jgi:cell division protein FtsW
MEEKVSVQKSCFLHKARGGKQKSAALLALDSQLCVITAFLILSGLIFTYSSSAFDGFAFFRRQLSFDALGVAVMLLLSQTYKPLQKVIRPKFFLWIAWALLIWALASPSVRNVRRWIDLGFFHVQPSEFAKLAIIIYLSGFLGARKRARRQDWNIFVAPVLFTAITAGLVYAGKDMGLPALICVMAFVIFFLWGAPPRKMLCWGLAAAPLLYLAILRHSYRLSRITSFIDPEKFLNKEGYQLSHSLYAIGSGGWFGKGLGLSDLKLAYLPDAHTDFIFAVICEEIGMLGAFLIIAAFLWLLARGLTIARRARDDYSSLLAAGITLCLLLQAFINMGVALGMLPTKGLPLPFFSYGGSSVVVTLAMIGILMNISAENKRSESE